MVHQFKVVLFYTFQGYESSFFLVPMHSGIWTICIDLSDSEIQQLGQYGFPHTNKCINYSIENSINMQDDLHSHSRMKRHLSMSQCSDRE